MCEEVSHVRRSFASEIGGVLFEEVQNKLAQAYSCCKKSQTNYIRTRIKRSFKFDVRGSVIAQTSNLR